MNLLYHPSYEHDACGVGFVAHIKGKKSHSIVEQGLGVLKNLSTKTRTLLREALVREILPDDADVTLSTSFIDLYLADDTAALDASSNVHDWRPRFPVLLHHGRDDLTVAYSVSARTLATMRARGSTSVSLTDCAARPAGHLDCVVPYFSFMLGRAAGAARDL